MTALFAWFLATGVGKTLIKYAWKIALGAFVVLAIVGGIAWFIHHERNLGAARCEAAVKAATDAEQERETKVNQDWQSWANGAVANADQQKAKMHDLEQQVADASAFLKGRACLPASVGDKLRLIDIPGDKADPAGRARGARR